jgi:hypothetical protein
MLCTMLTVRFTWSAGWRHALVAGVAWGVAFWFGPNMLPICLVWVACCMFDSSLRLRSCAMLAVSVLVVCPWIVRDWSQFGHLFWIRDSLGLELMVANNSAAAAILDNVAPPASISGPYTDRAGMQPPAATAPLDAIQAWQRGLAAYEFHPAGNPVACTKLQAMGEYGFMQMQQNRAVSWIRGHPLDFLRITGNHIWYFWLPAVPLFRRVLAGACGLLGLVGLLISWRCGWRARAALAGGLLVYPLVYYLVQAVSRYRQPVQPLIALSAAIALDPVWRRAMARWRGGEQRR